MLERVADCEGGVVYGNGYIRLFSGSHLLCTGYFYAFKADAAGECMYVSHGVPVVRDLLERAENFSIWI